ncbi:MAG: cytochrome ubiquinol oxidase subunit I [Bacteroidetes bacterium]|nr:cytochrome ubiquinol oxidase subunit I [Bacteroidota bacterium]
MLDLVDFSTVDWSRAQFALTAMYHWIFVPLTLGLSFIIAFMETIYIKTGNPEWKKITKFWMTLFGINFAIGIATGIILEFEFGTNWSNYSWFVGDIFGAPLAIEGILAFFLESTFIAVMFFGWDKIKPKAHLFSTWMVAIGSNLSALWILIANAWMQYPVGMHFNPDTARNEMLNFWEVFLSPVAINKFLHTVSSSYVLASVFVAGISGWFLLKNRHILFARRSILIAAVFGLIASVFTALTGDGSAQKMAEKQPMKFAAMEGHYDGMHGTPLIAFGVVPLPKRETEKQEVNELKYRFEIPKLLSYMAYRNFNAFVPGINDLVNGNPDHGILPVADKVKIGRIAIDALAEYKEARKTNDDTRASEALDKFQANYKYFGYGYFENDPGKLIPSVPLNFYSFRIMVGLGIFFIVLFLVVLVKSIRGSIEKSRFWLWLAIISIPLAYLAGQAGWLLAEMGRQPWIIQDLMPTMVAVSHINAGSVMVTFWLFAVLFTTLLIAEITIMVKQIKSGPKNGGND